MPKLLWILSTKVNKECALNYLKQTYPNVDCLIEQEKINHTVSVRGGFPKLPPNYVTRTSLVSILFSI